MSEEKNELQQDRTLTDADVDAIIDRTFDRFRINVGGGVLALAWKGVIVFIVVVAYYGWKKGGG
ncbi:MULTISPECIES: hypothetical protein [Aquitalea]|uniref:Uncharacterized protein n=2 Tax=Aquitalea TaxID=407217 RepID=A0A318IUI5_9NEIS|nr:hypothetical protein [Aquitalea magnusonii]MBA4707320.1 hypothetical protein [Aquitalea magnusonii]MBA4708757.1 hypothetical protein [Aquitalea magnusonii]PXX38854.1 hypothetical protein DFR38_1312 [Aquitalea magnusonii]PXX42781.1 hypothetical protein DFR38_11862 [Aquitalea magnusonii]